MSNGRTVAGTPREGTRFRLFPQAPYRGGRRGPETISLSSPAGTLDPGPSDDRMYVVDPIDKRRPYGLQLTSYRTPYLYVPPWNGPVRPPAFPDRDGHFDHLPVDAPQFKAAHAFGVVRFVLDVWERYFGRPIGWHFARDYERLEISLLPELENARAGWGFIELGSHVAEEGVHLFSLNFDVIAHELGHLLIYSEVGLPAEDAIEAEYFGFHEAGADLVALLAALHFDSVIDDLLELTRGNLYTFNELNRFAELSENQQIRIAGNGRKLSDFALGWSDEHDLSEPLTGAMFDIFVDIFHESLLERRLVGPEVEDLFDRLERSSEYAGLIQALFDEAFSRDPDGFRDALVEARDRLGVALAETWQRLSADSLNYDDVGDTLLEVDRDLFGGRYRRAILNNLLWREIGLVRVGPRLAPPTEASHAFSMRTLVPEHQRRAPRLSFHERWELVGNPTTGLIRRIGGDHRG